MAADPFSLTQAKEVVFYYNFSKKVGKTCSYGLKNLKYIVIKYLFLYKAWFHIIDTDHTSCTSAFKIWDIAKRSNPIRKWHM